jgi:hypothetical protein
MKVAGHILGLSEAATVIGPAQAKLFGFNA